MNYFEKITENLTAKKLAELLLPYDDKACHICIYYDNCDANSACQEGIEQGLMKEVKND